MPKKVNVMWKGNTYFVIRGQTRRFSEMLRRNGAVPLPGQRWGHQDERMAIILQQLIPQRKRSVKRWRKTEHLV